MSNQDHADREARAWMARLKSGQATAEDARAFEAWRRQSSAHEAAFTRAAKLWSLLGEIDSAAVERPKPRLLTRRGFAALGAGTLAGVAAIQSAAYLGHIPSARVLLADQSTATGSVRPLALPGISGALDGASAIDQVGPRRLRLVEGAAFVQRKPNDEGEMSLEVEAGMLRATVRAGAAEIRFGDQGVEIACAEGAVTLSAPEKIALDTGDAMGIRDDGALSRSTKRPTEIAAWIDGLMTFRDRRLGDVVADLNRHRTGRVILTRSALAERRVGGTFHLDRPDEIVSSLAESLRLRRRDLPAGIVLLS
ncbi:MAG: DUF4880 domain-containing protein [Pseudomonadota bacterium]